MWNGYKVIDADAHMHEPADMWERYVVPGAEISEMITEAQRAVDKLGAVSIYRIARLLR